MVIGFALLFSNNPFQHHIYLTSANIVSASIYDATSNVTSYFSLRETNDDLQRRNTELELENLKLKTTLRSYRQQLYADTMTVLPTLSRYNFTIATVINNSTNRSHNYITIDKGSLDGIEPEMGVIDQNGIVGIVNIVGDHTARLISVLNPYLRLSCKVKGKAQVGSLVWDGIDPTIALLEEIPKHTEFERGDTIVTSGYSSAFPEGVPVGTIISDSHDRDDNFYTLRIKLFNDFSTLSTVRVIHDNMREELKTIEKELKIKNIN